MSFISTTTTDQTLRSIQAQRNFKPESRPWETVSEKRDAECRQCGRRYLNTKREICASCGTATVEAIQ
jgi:rRNA maturation endonuclease Nob1